VVVASDDAVLTACDGMTVRLDCTDSYLFIGLMGMWRVLVLELVAAKQENQSR
jgi:hypothetical protein